MMLVYGSRTLTGARDLASFGIHNHSTVFCLMRVLGGWEPPADREHGYGDDAADATAAPSVDGHTVATGETGAVPPNDDDDDDDDEGGGADEGDASEGGGGKGAASAAGGALSGAERRASAMAQRRPSVMTQKRARASSAAAEADTARQLTEVCRHDTHTHTHAHSSEISCLSQRSGTVGDLIPGCCGHTRIHTSEISCLDDAEERSDDV
jgi:hypothetical protein